MANKDKIIVRLRLIGLNALSGQGFYAPNHCDLDIWPTDFEINRDHLWVVAIHDTKEG